MHQHMPGSSTSVQSSLYQKNRDHPTDLPVSIVQMHNRHRLSPSQSPLQIYIEVSTPFQQKRVIRFKTREVSAKGRQGHRPGPCATGRHPRGQWTSVFCLHPASANPSKPGLAVLGLASSRAGPPPGLGRGSGSVGTRDPAEPAREPTHPRAHGLWHLSRVGWAPSPPGHPGASCLDCQSHQSRGCHCRDRHHQGPLH